MVACRQMSKRALTSLVQGWEPVQGSTGLCCVGRPGYRTWEVRLEMVKSTKWHSTVLHVVPDFLICKLLLGQNYFLGGLIESLHYFHAAKAGINFFSSLDKWGIILWEEMEAHTCGGRSCAHPAMLVGFLLAGHCSLSLPIPVPAVGARHSFDLGSGARGRHPGNGAQAAQTRCKGLVKPGPRAALSLPRPAGLS